MRVLLAALPAVVRLAGLVRQHPGCYDEHDECELPTLPAHGASVAVDTLEWRLWPTPQEPEPLAPAAISDQNPSLLQAKGLPVASGIDVEIDIIFMPEPVSDGERPYYPRCILIFRGDNGVCCASNFFSGGYCSVTPGPMNADGSCPAGYTLNTMFSECLPSQASAVCPTASMSDLRGFEDFSREGVSEMEFTPGARA